MVPIEEQVGRFKFCPVCSKRLETNPNTDLPACFMHGDVRVVEGKAVFELLLNIFDRTPRCEKCGSRVHRDDAMNQRCNGCEWLVSQCICK